MKMRKPAAERALGAGLTVRCGAGLCVGAWVGYGAGELGEVLMEIGGIGFNGFDVVVLGVVLISTLVAASRGLARELISILALVVGLVVSLFVWGRFRFAAQDFIEPAWLADGALALGTFLVVYLLVIALMNSVKKSLLGREVGLVNRLLGAAFGAGRGLVIAALPVMVFTSAYIADRDRLREEAQEIQGRDDIPGDIRERLLTPRQSLPEWLESSTTYPILESIGDMIRKLPFADVRDAANDLKDGDIPDLRLGEESE